VVGQLWLGNDRSAERTSDQTCWRATPQTIVISGLPRGKDVVGEVARIAAIVFFQGRPGFQQVLRAEWSGLFDTGGGIWVHRPANAGHPHWQIDVADMLRQEPELASALELLRETGPREFGASQRADSAPWYRLDRIHFASAMRPWSDDLIAYGPEKLAHIRLWVIRTLTMMRLELHRL
jgi:hypothetical protein